jgi:hypothetical protein
MKNNLYTALATGALAAAALGVAGTANAAPGGPSSVDATISQLRALRPADVTIFVLVASSIKEEAGGRTG